MEFSEVKKLGFGLMRLPMKDDVIDLELTGKMVDRFMDAGYRYFDTAWAYPGSEEAIGKALVQRYPRESYWLTSKLSAWRVADRTEQEAKEQLKVSLERTGAGYFDLYLLHNMGDGREKAFDRFHIWDFFKEMKEEGLIRHIGFSTHGGPELTERLLLEHPEVEFVQLQINYADWEDPTIRAKANYEVARKYGKTVIVMEPVKGGLLANPPKEVAEIFSQSDPSRTASSWALRFPASLPGVGVVLSGMSNMEQMEDNIATFDSFRELTEEEKRTIDQARRKMEEMPLIPCTSCGYCMEVCPYKIGIPGAFQALNIERVFHDTAFAKGRAAFNITLQKKTPPSQCIGCGACEEACPQHLPIRRLLQEFNDKGLLS